MTTPGPSTVFAKMVAPNQWRVKRYEQDTPSMCWKILGPPRTDPLPVVQLEWASVPGNTPWKNFVYAGVTYDAAPDGCNCIIFLHFSKPVVGRCCVFLP